MASENPSFLDKFSLSFEELWNNHKIFLLFFGILLFVVKFRNVLTDVLLASARQTLQDAQKQDSALAVQENDAKQQADALVKKANGAPLNKEPSDDDWFKK